MMNRKRKYFSDVLPNSPEKLELETMKMNMKTFLGLTNCRVFFCGGGGNYKGSMLNFLC